MAIELLGVGICRWILLREAAEAGAEEMSPTSEKMSPRSAYRLELKESSNQEKFGEVSSELTWNCWSATALDSAEAHKDAQSSACSHSKQSDFADVAEKHD